jgi:hypothetical protein
MKDDDATHALESQRKLLLRIRRRLEHKVELLLLVLDDLQCGDVQRKEHVGVISAPAAKGNQRQKQYTHTPRQRRNNNNTCIHSTHTDTGQYIGDGGGGWRGRVRSQRVKPKSKKRKGARVGEDNTHTYTHTTHTYEKDGRLSHPTLEAPSSVDDEVDGDGAPEPAARLPLLPMPGGPDGEPTVGSGPAESPFCVEGGRVKGQRHRHAYTNSLTN